MKSSEFHRKVKKNGWRFLRAQGTSHYIYEKGGRICTVPFHGAKEIPTGLQKKMEKELGL